VAIPVIVISKEKLKLYRKLEYPASILMWYQFNASLFTPFSWQLDELGWISLASTSKATNSKSLRLSRGTRLALR
jgi:hypothetical protein